MEENIKVKDIMECLSTFNPEADFHILIKGIEFEIDRSCFCWTTEKAPQEGVKRNIDEEKRVATDVAILIKNNKI